MDEWYWKKNQQQRNKNHLNINFFVNSEHAAHTHTKCMWLKTMLYLDDVLNGFCMLFCYCFFLKEKKMKRTRLERRWCDVQKQQRLYAIFQKQNWQIMLDFLLHYVTYMHQLSISVFSLFFFVHHSWYADR